MVRGWCGDGLASAHVTNLHNAMQSGCRYTQACSYIRGQHLSQQRATA
jgi:hypothetical protein